MHTYRLSSITHHSNSQRLLRGPQLSLPRRYFSQEAKKDQKPTLDETEEEESQKGKKQIPEDEEIPELDDYQEESRSRRLLKYLGLGVGLYFLYDYMWPFIGGLMMGKAISTMENVVETASTGDNDDVRMLLEGPGAMMYKHIWLVLLATGDPGIESFVEQEGIARCLALCRMVEKGELDLDHIAGVANLIASVASTEKGRAVCAQNAAVMRYAMSFAKSARPELSMQGFVALRNLLMNKALQQQFVDMKGVQMLCQAFHAQKSQQLVEMSFIILSGFLYNMPPVADLKLTQKDLGPFFMTITQIGGAMQEQGSPQLAVNAYESALQLDPTNAELLTVCGILQVQCGHPDAAAEKFQAALEHKPGSPQASYQLAKYIVQKAKGVDRAALADAADLLISGLPELRKGAPSNPNQLPGMPQAKRGGRRLTHPLTSPTFSLLVLTLERLGRLDDAKAYAEEWSLWCINEDKPQTSLGQLLYKSGQYEQALVLFQKSFRLAPDKASLPYLVAMTEWELGKYEAALASVEQAVALAAHDEREFKRSVRRAEAKQAAIDEEAKKGGFRPLQVEMPKPPIVNVLEGSLLLKGRILTRLERLEEAAEALHSSHAQQKPSDSDATAVILAGHCLAKLNRLEDAATEFQAALQIWRDSVLEKQCSFQEFFGRYPEQSSLRDSIMAVCDRHSSEPALMSLKTQMAGLEAMASE